MITSSAFTPQETPKEAALRNLTGEIHLNHFQRWLDNGIYSNALADFVEGVNHIGLGQINTLAGPAKHLLGAIPDLCEKKRYFLAMKSLVASSMVLRSRKYEVRKLNAKGEHIVKEVETLVDGLIANKICPNATKEELIANIACNGDEEYIALYEAILDTGKLPEDLPAPSR